MEEELNYQEELAKARVTASKLTMNGHEDEIEAYWEVVCGTVLVAEENLHNQDCEWENASLAREMLEYARQLEGFDHMQDNLYQALSRMADAVYEHPRLKAELIEFELKTVKRLENLQGGKTELIEELTDELDTLKNNIQLADEGRLNDIPQTGHLKHDPVEWTSRWEEVIDEADRKAYARLADMPRGMGFCHGFWHERAEVLRKDYHLEWRSPGVMNPRVMFD